MEKEKKIPNNVTLHMKRETNGKEYFIHFIVLIIYGNIHVKEILGNKSLYG